jgi:hypothetical protein
VTRPAAFKQAERVGMNALPPITNDDRLPHEKAVWREEIPLQPIANRPVSVDYDGAIECTTGEKVDWALVKRWRFGWPPQPAADPFEGLGLAAKE